ncbi:hypothetical protein GCM10010365_12610 [Streptomyces poonensis]|uniref:ANTAR domain-containing protein n=1 Tax=Streptomyces poonensis TaxID=68255 RepID=A0A918PAY6_9ACTN|nr:hypothetical protein GCM10010365_12610 [Streptomyces poonensis]GLJ88792.1 hypothetical protein GCM10017589_13920 [Streptomyces poonensis]
MNTRLVIEQAKGVLAARTGIGMEEPLVRVRSHAHARQRELGELATRAARRDLPRQPDPMP